MSKSKQQDWMTRVGATPGKLALIAVLGVILTYVVVSQLPSRLPAPAELITPTAGSETAPAALAKADPASESRESLPEVKPWPRPNLRLATTHDPFATPAWARSAVTSAELNLPQADSSSREQADAIAELRQLGAAVIVEVDGEPLALVGNHQLRVGDRVRGFRVEEITASGIVLTSEEGSP